MIEQEGTNTLRYWKGDTEMRILTLQSSWVGTSQHLEFVSEVIFDKTIQGDKTVLVLRKEND